MPSLQRAADVRRSRLFTGAVCVSNVADCCHYYCPPADDLHALITSHSIFIHFYILEINDEPASPVAAARLCTYFVLGSHN
jgi:hypothetical protein